jgi:drug/metabolite transporter, DME family
LPRTDGRPAKMVRGYLLVATAAFCWAGSANLAKAAFAGRLFLRLGPVDVLTLTQMRTTVSVVVLGLVLLGTRGWRRMRVRRGTLAACLLLGALGVAGSNYFYYYAISRTTVATAIMVQYLAPAYVLLYRLFMREERASGGGFAAIGCAFAGCALTVGVGSVAHLNVDALGVLAAVAAGVCFAYYNIGGARLAGEMDNVLLMLYATAGAALLWLPIHPPTTWVRAHYSWQQWAFTVVFALISMLVPYLLYFQALRFLDPTRAIVTACLEPVFAVILAASLLGESLAWLQMAGVGLVLIATLFLELRPRQAMEVPVG